MNVADYTGNWPVSNGINHRVFHGNVVFRDGEPEVVQFFLIELAFLVEFGELG